MFSSGGAIQTTEPHLGFSRCVEIRVPDQTVTELYIHHTIHETSGGLWKCEKGVV